MEISLLWRQMYIFVETWTFQLQNFWQNHVCVDVSSKGFQRFLTMTINVRIMPAASEQRLFIQSGLNAAAGRKETELIYYFSPDFHSARFLLGLLFHSAHFFAEPNTDQLIMYFSFVLLSHFHSTQLEREAIMISEIKPCININIPLPLPLPTWICFSFSYFSWHCWPISSLSLFFFHST